MVIRESVGDRVFNVINVVLLFLVLVVTAYPLYFVLIASFSDPNAVQLGQVLLLPKQLTLGGYELVYNYQQIWTGYRNSIFYAAAGTLISLVVTLTAAYALSRKDLKFRNIFTTFFMITMFFGGGLIPFYILVSKTLHLSGTIWAMLLTGATGMYNIILSRTFFQSTIPDELREAAEIDGCSNIRFFVSVVLPLSSAIIAVMALFFIVGFWNDYFTPYLFLSDSKSKNLQPLALILRDILIIGQVAMDQISKGMTEANSAVEYARRAMILKYSLIIVSAVPLLVAYPFIQKYFVKGVMVGSIKG